MVGAMPLMVMRVPLVLLEISWVMTLPSCDCALSKVRFGFLNTSNVASSPTNPSAGAVGASVIPEFDELELALPPLEADKSVSSISRTCSTCSACECPRSSARITGSWAVSSSAMLASAGAGNGCLTKFPVGFLGVPRGYTQLQYWLLSPSCSNPSPTKCRS